LRPDKQRQKVLSQSHICALFLISMLSSCTTAENAGIAPNLGVDAVDPVRKADLTASIPSASRNSGVRAQGALQPQYFPGEDPASSPAGPSNSAPPPKPQYIASMGGAGLDPGGEGIQINFENADVRAVSKVILTDTLGLNVAVDPRVQGTVTLVSAAPIAKKDLLVTFENVMRMFNAAVVRDGDLVKIVPLTEAAGAGGTLTAGEGGYGVSILPLRYTSAATLAKTAENFISRPNAVRADPGRNLLLVQGTAVERQNVAEMIESFDVEWLKNQSVALFPLKSTSPDTMIHELERVFDTADGGQGQGVISFQPVTRMNAVMAVTRNQRFLTQAAQWVKRLDRSDTSGTTVRVYSLEYGSASKVAKVLNDIFVGRNGSSSADSAASQLAPNTKGAESRLDAISASAGMANGAPGPSGAASPNPQSSFGTLNSSSFGQTSAASFAGFADQKPAAGDNKDSSAGTTGSLPRGVFQNVRITADASNNSIIIYSNQEDYRVIERSLRELDRAQRQVAIDATIAEVTLTDALQYGVQYYLGSSNVGAGVNNGSISLSASSLSPIISQALPGLNVLLGQQASPKVVLSALSTLTSVKVLSAPSLVVADNQPAFLQVGDSVPVSTGSATVLSASNTIVNTITMQDTGVILKVMPHIHPNGTVELEIEQEVSAVVGGISSTTANLNPTISQRRIHSTVDVPNGQTVLLGGLMSEEDDHTKAGIPFLNQIQGIGDLFGNTNGSKTRTEIIVFVRPRIIKDGLDAQSVAEEFRSRLRSMHDDTSIIKGYQAPESKGSAAAAAKF